MGADVGHALGRGPPAGDRDHGVRKSLVQVYIKCYHNICSIAAEFVVSEDGTGGSTDAVFDKKDNDEWRDIKDDDADEDQPKPVRTIFIPIIFIQCRQCRHDILCSDTSHHPS